MNVTPCARVTSAQPVGLSSLSRTNSSQLAARALLAASLLLGCATLSSAHVWDRTVFNDVEQQIQIIPKPLGGFYAKVSPYFASSIKTMVPGYVPPAFAPRPRSRAPGLASYIPPIRFCDCGGGSYVPPVVTSTPVDSVSPVPLPPTAWMLAPALMLLIKVGRRA